MLLKYDFFKKIQKKSIKPLQPLKIGALVQNTYFKMA